MTPRVRKRGLSCGQKEGPEDPFNSIKLVYTFATPISLVQSPRFHPQGETTHLPEYGIGSHELNTLITGPSSMGRVHVVESLSEWNDQGDKRPEIKEFLHGWALFCGRGHPIPVN